MAVASVVAKFEADISDVQSKMATLKKTFQDATDSTNSMSSRLQAVGGSMATIGRKMTIGLSLPLAAVGAASIKTAMDFETSMNKIVGLVGIAADEVKAMESDVLAMAATTGKAPQELADGLFVVTSAGLRGAEAMATLEQSAKAGAAGLGETNDIARAVSGALSAYGSDVLSAADATDQIVATARAGNFETSQFAAAIGRVLPFAEQAGASFAEMGGAVALLTRVNGNAAQSVTQMAALFRAFVVPTEEAKKSLADLGMSAEDMRKSIADKGLPATLQMLDQALGGNREQLGRLLGSSEAASAAFQILGADAATLEETFGVVADSAGMTEEAFDSASQTAQFKMNQALAQMKAALIEVGNAIMPVATVMIEFAKVAMQGFTSLPGPIKTVAIAFGGILAVMGPLLLIGGKIMVMLGRLSVAWTKLKARATEASLSMLNSFLGLQARASTALGAMRAQMAATEGAFRKMGVVAKTMALGVVGALRTVGGALKGLMASLGPIGIAMIGLSVAFEVVAGSNAEAERKAAEYKDTLTELTGAATEATTELVALSLATQTTGFWFFAQSVEDLGKSIGLSLEDMTRAVLMTEAEYSAFIDTLNLTPEAPNAADLVVDALNREREAIQLTRTELDDKNRSMQVANNIAGLYDDAHSRAALSAGRLGSAAGSAIDPVTGLAVAGDEAADGMNEAANAFDTLMGSLSAISAVDRAKQSIADIGAAAVESGTKLMGEGPKAEAFRSTVIRAFEDSSRAATLLGDGVEEQRQIFTGELIKIVAALRESGVKTKDIESFLGAMDDLPYEVSQIMQMAAQAVGDTDFKSSIEQAFKKSVDDGRPMTADAMARMAEGASQAAKEKLGLTLEPELRSIIEGAGRTLMKPAEDAGRGPGGRMGAGIAAGISASSPIVQAAVRRVIQEAKAAADAAAESASPSRLFAETGDDIVAGIAMGVTRSGGKATNAISAVVRRMVAAFQNEVRDVTVGPVQSAFERVFGSRAEIRDSSRALQDASWALADARDAVVQAEKALSEARKEGNAREVAAAERDLARARRDAADAADAEKTAKFVAENQKALLALEKITQQYDYIKNALEQTTAAFTQLRELTATPFGLDSAISQMFGTDTDVRQLANNFAQIEQIVRDAYAALIDPKIVGRAAARQNRREMNSNLRQIEEYVAKMIELRQELDAGLIEEERLRGELAKVTSAFDEANNELKRIVAERDGFMRQITSGFRGFVNNLSGLTDQTATAMKESVRDLGNGVRLIMQAADPTSAAGAIAANLESRLAQVREFSKNIRSLMERGLDPAMIRDFIEAGVSGAGDTVAALVGATDDELKGINATQAELLKLSEEFAKESGDTYYAGIIAGQQAVVDGLQSQVDAAQAALDTVSARNKALAEEIATLGETIASMVEELATTLPPRTLQAGQDAVDKMIEGFDKRFPEMKRYFNKLMDELVKSMRRTVTIDVQTTGAATSTRAQANTFNTGTVPLATPAGSGRNVTVASNAVNVTITGGGGNVNMMEQVKRAVDESLQELAREITAA